MKYLVTGGAGFIGSNLVDSLLKDGHDVVVIDNFNDYYDVKIKEENVFQHLNNLHYSLYKVDIEDIKSLKDVFSQHRFDAVIHLAARAGVRASIENSIAYVNTNILGTVNILECIKQYNIPKLVIASSSSVYGNCKADKFSEDIKVSEPISPYAATKLACEELCYTWHHLYGTNITALRFFTVYGPRQRPDLAIYKFVKKIENNEVIQMYGNGETLRDYTYIDDIVFGIRSAVQYVKTGFEIINLGGGEPISLKHMICVIEKTLNKTAKIEQIDMQPGDVEKTVCDWTKAKQLLNYTPNTNFEDGINKFIKWFRQR